MKRRDFLALSAAAVVTKPAFSPAQDSSPVRDDLVADGSGLIVSESFNGSTLFDLTDYTGTVTLPRGCLARIKYPLSKLRPMLIDARNRDVAITLTLKSGMLHNEQGPARIDRSLSVSVPPRLVAQFWAFDGRVYAKRRLNTMRYYPNGKDCAFIYYYPHPIDEALPRLPQDASDMTGVFCIPAGGTIGYTRRADGTVMRQSITTSVHHHFIYLRNGQIHRDKYPAMLLSYQHPTRPQKTYIRVYSRNGERLDTKTDVVDVKHSGTVTKFGYRSPDKQDVAVINHAAGKAFITDTKERRA